MVVRDYQQINITDTLLQDESYEKDVSPNPRK